MKKWWCLLVLAGQLLLPASANELPDFGSPADAILNKSREGQLGRSVMLELRNAGVIVDDPLLTEYIQSIGADIASHANNGTHRFQFFVVDDDRINAFAMPGGYIGIHTGLILASENENELAGVIAHEVSHVTQRHIARMVRAQGRQSIATTAAIVAAILIGAMSGGAGGDVVQGAIAAAQGAAVQQQINFTRAHEYEADRVGIGILAAAGFDPKAMADFFETMGRRVGLAQAQVPELLQTHPVTTNRIAEARNRAAQFDHPKSPESLSYALARERLRVITAPRETDVHAYYARLREQREPGLGERYGEALALMNAGRPAEAARILDELWSQHESVPLLAAALGQAQMAAGLTNDAIATFERAITLSPRNVPITVRYAEALMRMGDAKKAHALLLDLFNNVPPTPDQIRLTALAASAAGDIADAYYYMAEYHIASGDLPLAMQQLELALAVPNLTPVQRQRFEARLEMLREARANQPRRMRSSDHER